MGQVVDTLVRLLAEAQEEGRPELKLSWKELVDLLNDHANDILTAEEQWDEWLADEEESLPDSYWEN